MVRDRRHLILTVAGAMMTAALLALAWGSFRESAREGNGVAAEATASQVELTGAELDLLAAAIADRLGGGASVTPTDGLPTLGRRLGPAYAVLREGGAARADAWGDGDTAIEAILEAVENGGGQLEGDAVTRIDAVELAITHSYQPVSLDDEQLSNVERGVRGLELQLGGEVARYSPTWMIATNRSFDRVVDLFAEQHGVTEDAIQALDAQTFAAEQVLVLLDGEPEARSMFRGNEVVALDQVTREGIAASAELMGDWLLRNLHADGRMTYKYWPSRGEESAANNMIRQWMATVALGRLATAADPAIWEASRRNVDYNLAQFYGEEDGLGLIIEDGTKVKLGAVALAAVALLEHRDRPDFQHIEAALLRTVDHLWQPSGRFRTWYAPPERDDQHNFYPGEALYAWSVVYGLDPDDTVPDRFMRSFRYYRDWHLDDANRNPAFVPWHTQAYYRVWRHTRDPDLQDFVLEMNDWLLGVQQWDGVRYPDTRGRFYDPARPHFGPPHVSSTGVYLEGLIDAFSMAREVGDDARAERYRLAILRGLRSVLQLQFVDEVDMYYVTQRDRVVGGVRTTVYDNEIRVDNVQHNLMAILKILEAFDASDFLPR